MGAKHTRLKPKNPKNDIGAQQNDQGPPDPYDQPQHDESDNSDKKRRGLAQQKEQVLAGFLATSQFPL
jgi:hypothetical protein